MNSPDDELGSDVDLGIAQNFQSKTTTGFVYEENSGNNSALSSQYQVNDYYDLFVVCHAHDN